MRPAELHFSYAVKRTHILVKRSPYLITFPQLVVNSFVTGGLYLLAGTAGVFRAAAPEGTAYENFRNAYRARFNSEPKVYCDTVYDAVKLIALAAQKAGSEDPEKVRQALLEVGKNYQGVSGTITFDDQGDRVSGTYEVWKVVKEGTEYRFARVKLIPM